MSDTDVQAALREVNRVNSCEARGRLRPGELAQGGHRLLPSYASSYRRNPLSNIGEVLQEVSQQMKTSLSKKFRELQSSVDAVYRGEAEEYTLRNIVQYLAEIAAYEDCLAFTQELEAVVEEDRSAFDESLSALRSRLRWLVENPPIASIKQRFRQMQVKFRLDFEGIIFQKNNYSDDFPHPDDQFVESYLHRFVFWIYSVLLDKLQAAHRAPDSYQFINGELRNVRHEEYALQLTENELATILDDINSVISGRNMYGHRSHPASNLDSTKIVWSNGSKSWHILRGWHVNQLVAKHVYGNLKPSQLDANEIIVPYPEPVVELLLSSLYPLPLYSYSWEAKREKRGSVKGPVVSDRTAKTIVRSIANQHAQIWYEAMYGTKSPDLSSDWMVKAVENQLWEDLLAAKAEGSMEDFREAIQRAATVRFAKALGLEDLVLDLPPAWIGQLINWFNALSF